MKKLLSLTLTLIILLSVSTTVSAYDFFNDMQENGFYCEVNDSVYLTQETKAGDLKYFGERITIADRNGNTLSADDYISTGCKVTYFDMKLATITVLGDFDCNGRITAKDARNALRYSAGLKVPEEESEGISALDTDCSGTLRANDAREILRAAAKLSKFETFKENIKNTIYYYDNYIPKDKDNYLLAVYMHPDYRNNPDCLKPEFYGDLVKEVIAADGNTAYALILHDPSYENAMLLKENLITNDAVIMTLIEPDYYGEYYK